MPPSNTDQFAGLGLVPRALSLDTMGPNPTGCPESGHTPVSSPSDRLLLQDSSGPESLTQTLQDHRPGLLHFLSTERRRRPRLKEPLIFMKGVMDECTHVGNFSGASGDPPTTQQGSTGPAQGGLALSVHTGIARPIGPASIPHRVSRHHRDTP